jgi:uncharacterized protein (TIGR03435 family)
MELRWIVGFFAALAFVSGVLSPARVAAERQTAGTGDRRLAFEVAILKPDANSGLGVTGGCRGIDSNFAAGDPRAAVPLGRCVISAGALRHLMAIAFDLPLNRITGFPEWDGANRFDIQAKADDPATTSERQLLSMLQQFLIAEFSLSVHREQKEGPTFSLVATKNGPKNLRPSSETGCRPSPSKVLALSFKGCSMQDFASFLSTVPSVQRRVSDRTALSGRFDFDLEVGSKAQDIAGLKAAMAAWESLFSDIQEQLGLRLDRSTGSVETLVIDHAELPREK